MPEKRSDGTRWNRRRFLEATVASTGFLAGCSGGGGGGGGDGSDGGYGGGGDGSDGSGGDGSSDGGGLEKSEFTFTTGPSESLAFQMANQLATRLKQSSPLVMNVKGATSSQSVSLLVTGQTELAYATALIGQRANDQSGTFADLDYKQDIMQVMSYYWIRVGLVSKVSSDIEYYSDLPGNTIAPGPSGASYWAPFRAAFDEVGMNYDNVNVQNSGVSQLANILSADDAAAVGGPMYINNLVPSFIEKIYSQNDVRMLAWKPGNVDKIKQSDKVSITPVANNALGENIQEFSSSGETPMVSANYVMYSSAKMPTDTIYTMMNAIWENLDKLAEAHPGFKPWQNEEFWTANMVPQIPVHPGAAKFLKEKELWNDDFTAASI